MRIKDASPGDTVIITEGPAKGREVSVIAKGGDRVAISGQGQGSVVRGDLEVEP